MEVNKRRYNGVSMIIPTFVKQQIVDTKTGEPTPTMQNYFDNLNQQMQRNLSEDGFVIPPRSTTQIQAITDPANPNARGVGTIWYDTTLNKFVGNENGVLVSFSTVPI